MQWLTRDLICDTSPFLNKNVLCYPESICFYLVCFFSFPKRSLKSTNIHTKNILTKSMYCTGDSYKKWVFDNGFMRCYCQELPAWEANARNGET